MLTITLTMADLASDMRMRDIAAKAREEVLSNSETDHADLLALAAGDVDVKTAVALLDHAKTDREVADTAVATLSKRYGWGYGGEKELIRIVSDKRVSPNTAVRFASRVRDTATTIAAIERGDITAEQANDLPGRSELGIAKAIIGAGLATEDMLKKLAMDHRVSYRTAAANATCTPADILNRLSHDMTPQIRAAVARNTSTEADRLRVMVKDTDATVARAALRNLKKRNEPTEVLSDSDEISADDPVFGFFFAQADDPIIRLDIARNPDTDPNTLTSMLTHDDDATAEAAAANPSLPIEQMEEIVNAHLAITNETDWQELQQLAIRLHRIAANPSLPSELAEKALIGPENYRAFRNEDTFIRLLERLDVVSEAVQETILSRFRWCAALMRKLASKDGLSDETCLKILDRGSFQVKRALAGNPSCNVGVLQELAANPDERIAKKAKATLETVLASV